MYFSWRVALVPGVMVKGGSGMVKQVWPGSSSVMGAMLRAEENSSWILGSGGGCQR